MFPPIVSQINHEDAVISPDVLITSNTSIIFLFSAPLGWPQATLLLRTGDELRHAVPFPFPRYGEALGGNLFI